MVAAAVNVDMAITYQYFSIRAHRTLSACVNLLMWLNTCRSSCWIYLKSSGYEERYETGSGEVCLISAADGLQSYKER